MANATSTYKVIFDILTDVCDEPEIKRVYREFCEMREALQYAADHGRPEAMEEMPTPAEYAEYERRKAEQPPAGWFIYWED